MQPIAALFLALAVLACGADAFDAETKEAMREAHTASEVVDAERAARERRAGREVPQWCFHEGPPRNFEMCPLSEVRCRNQVVEARANGYKQARCYKRSSEE